MHCTRQEEMLGSIVKVVNITGQVVNVIILNSQLQKINMSNQPAGIYMIQISNDSKVYTHRFVLK